MLILKNISKTYTTKGGVTHRALENITLSFDEKGLVFILGKSGSGKSTLLNIISGIDTFDRGEIFIGNRSFSNFSPKDFNSYRNTIVGFVYQEYNLIDAYKTYDNIRLSLSLQSKRDEHKVEETLKKLELEELRDRKTFELSGGQKQRIAIARALIKEPKILLADEPTGSLDETTGAEIFKILKELSKERLVIVVSHNRDLAEEYGDRVIEIKDGEILKDLANNVEHEVIEENQFIAKSIYKLPSNQQIGEAEVANINELMKTNPRDYYISVEQKTNKVKSMYPHLKEALEGISGEQEKFRQYAFKKEKDLPDITLVKSKLPYMDALKLGMININKKKVNLIILLFVAIASIVVFGFSYNLSNYDIEAGYVNLITTTKPNSLILSNNLQNNDYGSQNLPLREKQVEAIEDRWDYTIKYYNQTSISVTNMISGVCEVEDFETYFNYDFILKSTSFGDENGIIISQYVADLVISELSVFGFNDYQDVIDYPIISNDAITMPVVGIYQFDYSKYQTVLKGYYDYADYELYTEFLELCDIHLSRLFMQKGAYRKFIINDNQINSKLTYDVKTHQVVLLPLAKLQMANVTPIANVPAGKVSIYITQYVANLLFGAEGESDPIAAITKFNNASPNLIFSQSELTIIGYASNQIKIKGIILGSYANNIYADDEIYVAIENIVLRPDKMGVHITDFSHNNVLSDIRYAASNSLSIAVEGSFNALSFAELIDFMKDVFQVFMYLMAIIVIVLLYFFLASSIKKNRRQIGILRALGANQSDIFKIFIAEAVIIGTIALVASYIMYAVVGVTLNYAFVPEGYIPLILITLPTYLWMGLLTIGVLAIALILPIIRIARIKILDLILEM